MRFSLNLLLGIMLIFAGVSIVPSVHDAAKPVHFMLSQGSIIINELMYDPLGSEAVEEWVELHNPGTSPVNVTGWSISDQDGDPDFIFPNMTFPAGGYALVHIGEGQNSTAFVSGTADFYMWKTAGIWTATGDDVLLADSNDTTIDFLSYGEWDGYYVDPAPADFPYSHSNASASEGFSISLANGVWLASVPSPMEHNGDDSTSRVLIVQVHYDAFGDNEFFTICNTQDTNADISRWYLTDGEGILVFPSGTIIPARRNITICQNPINYALQTLETADYEYSGLDPAIPDMAIMSSAPALANDGDELMLFTNFVRQIDAFVYGYSDYEGPGWSSEPCPDLKEGGVAKRAFNQTFVDTNTSADWESPRPYFIGQSVFSSPVFNVPGKVTLFTSPDSSYGVIADALDSATQSIAINLYEFTSTAMAGHVLSAIGRGVDTRLFMEGSPVGGINETEVFILRQIVEAGGSVRLLTNDPDADIHERYDYDHAKYVVLDNASTLIMSENWGASGVPQANRSGNRGWGALIEDTALAGYFRDVFDTDYDPARMDSVAFDSAHPLWSSWTNWSYDGADRAPNFEPLQLTGPSSVQPVLSPDTSLNQDTIIGLLGSATERVYVEQFYIYKHWGDRTTGSTSTTPNLYLEAVIDAARRGCEVRILLDSTYYNTMESDPIDNDDTVEYVNLIAASEHLDLEAKLIDLDEHGFAKVHNKGMIVDDSVLISSINWNYQSAALNRESGIILRNPGAAEYFQTVFDYDWQDDLTPPFAHFRANESYQVNTTVLLNASTSSDNVGITNYTWSLDGSPVLFGPDFEWNFTSTGQYQLNLIVADAWGNNDTCSRQINITRTAPPVDDDGGDTDETPDGGDGTSDDSPTDSSFSKMILVFLMVPIFIFGALVGVIYAKRR